MEQRHFWVARNNGNQDFNFWEQWNKATYFRGTREYVNPTGRASFIAFQQHQEEDKTDDDMHYKRYEITKQHLRQPAITPLVITMLTPTTQTLKTKYQA